MEGVLLEFAGVELGVLLSGIVLLAIAFGEILMGYLADQEKAGKRFFWIESSLPEPELGSFLPKGVGIRRTA